MKKYYFSFVLLFTIQSVWGQLSPEQADSIARLRQQDDSMIRAARAVTNQMIANHDARGLGRYMYPDYIRIAGNGSIAIGKDAAVSYWTKTFKDQPTIYYVRTTLEILISDNGLYAWETGGWTGINTKSKSGRYAAHWAKQDGIWKMQNENYLTLSTY